MPTTTVSVAAGPLTRRGLVAPFGWIPVADTDPADGGHRLHFEWGDPHLNVIAHYPDEIERTADGLRVRRCCTGTPPTPRRCWSSTSPRSSPSRPPT